MSLLKWITGGDFTSHLEEGERFMSAGNYGEARLAFQRALKKSSKEKESDVANVREKMQSCARNLAMGRLEKAREFLEEGDFERAADMANDVLMIDAHSDVEKAVEQLLTEIDSRAATAEADEDVEMTDDELLAVIAGAWSTGMAAEFATYPEAFYRALMIAHEGDSTSALQLLDSMAGETNMNEAVYFYLEKARLQLISEDTDGAHASLLRFIEKAEEAGAETVEELWVAYEMLSTIHTTREEYQAAEDALLKAYRAAPGNHVPLLHLGIFLRERGELARSKRTLENAMDIMGAIHPDMRVFRELGLTHLALEERKEAVGCFKAVLDHCCHTVGHEQYDPEAAIPLATLYEEDGKLQEASDIYRHLANGYDTENIFIYNLEAARLLQAQNAAKSLVNQYIEEARTLASTAAQKEALERMVASVGEQLEK